MWLVAEKEITVKHAGKSVTVPAGQQFNIAGASGKFLLRDGHARKLTADEKAAREEADEGEDGAKVAAEPADLLEPGKVPVVMASDAKPAKKGRR